MSIPSNEQYLEYLLAQAPARKRRGCVASTIEFLCTVAVVALAVCGGYFLLEIWVDTPAAPQTQDGNYSSQNRVTDNHYQSTENGYRQQPVVAPAELPDCATVQDTTTACEQTNSVLNGVSTPSPTPTAEPTPTPAGFWTEADYAAWTATAEAYYNPETLPTAAPAFVQAVQEGCQDPTKVAQSKLLASWCGEGE